MLFVLSLERKLGRKLTSEEIESPMGVDVVDKNGVVQVVFIPELNFPLDLVNEHLVSSEDESEIDAFRFMATPTRTLRTSDPNDVESVSPAFHLRQELAIPGLSGTPRSRHDQKV
jgi:hypothetical protein